MGVHRTMSNVRPSIAAAFPAICLASIAFGRGFMWTLSGLVDLGRQSEGLRPLFPFWGSDLVVGVLLTSMAVALWWGRRDWARKFLAFAAIPLAAYELGKYFYLFGQYLEFREFRFLKFGIFVLILAAMLPLALSKPVKAWVALGPWKPGPLEDNLK
ncbi:hypothetical protein BWI17_18145 [Betaproteobacteria bacterium GR16-43]|nr:hypothetical protein BWI17_18145 [Betaproteobacteria bacterium GR16-43]